MKTNTMANIYQTFRRFLRDNGCERQFDAAFYEQCGANVLDETLADILVIDEGFFGRVFRWDLTPEGREFWKDIDDKWWKRYLKC
ncbi:MAG: hypothetical protein KBS73_03115 [Bacteroidales bacterium]|nr:hypothetical protein [Candidatus Cacconaster equifaecalis]